MRIIKTPKHPALHRGVFPEQLLKSVFFTEYVATIVTKEAHFDKTEWKPQKRRQSIVGAKIRVTKYQNTPLSTMVLFLNNCLSQYFFYRIRG